MLVALGSDYNIFITGRIREEIDAGRSVADATREALTATGPTITAAGMVLAGTFAAMLITPIANVRQLGFGVAVGILIDTFVVRSLVVPAATILLGRYAFWPSTGLPVARQVRWANPAAGTAVLAVATVLGVIAFAGRGGEPVVEVAAAPLAQARSAATASSSPPPRAVAADGAVTKKSTPRAITRERTASASAVRSPSPVPRTASPEPRSGGDRPRAPEGTATSPNRIAVPTAGEWRYRATGTRSIGAAGSDVPFDEEAASRVERTGESSREAQVRVTTRTSFATVQETRRYAARAVSAREQQVSAAGLGYGGSLDPAQVLFALPVRIGDQVTSRWTAGGVRGRTESTVVEARRFDLDGRNVDCYLVDRRTTMTGDVVGEQRQRTCWAPKLGMPVTDELEVTGTYRGVAFTGVVRLSLIAPPRNNASPAAKDVRPGEVRTSVLGRSRRP